MDKAARNQPCADVQGRSPNTPRSDGQAVTAIASSADFYPEDGPPGFVEWTFLVPAKCEFGAGVYEIRFVRALTEAERKQRGWVPTILAANEAAPLSVAAQVPQPIREPESLLSNEVGK
jgi:hypothetical protein